MSSTTSTSEVVFSLMLYIICKDNIHEELNNVPLTAQRRMVQLLSQDPVVSRDKAKKTLRLCKTIQVSYGVKKKRNLHKRLKLTP